jgi:hypothetical protein
MFEVIIYLCTSYAIIAAVYCIARPNVGWRRRMGIAFSGPAAVLLLFGTIGVLPLVGYLALAPPLSLLSFSSFIVFEILLSLLIAQALASQKWFGGRRGQFRRTLLTITLLMLPLLPYAVVETQTSIFATDMIPAARRGLKQDGWFGDQEIVQLKVLLVTRESATVYIVSQLDPSDPESGLYADTLELVSPTFRIMLSEGAKSLVIWAVSV